MPPLLADFTHARPCKPFCEKYLTLPYPDLDTSSIRQKVGPSQGLSDLLTDVLKNED